MRHDLFACFGAVFAAKAIYSESIEYALFAVVVLVFGLWELYENK